MIATAALVTRGKPGIYKRNPSGEEKQKRKEPGTRKEMPIMQLLCC
jgi:hypothetical protein